MSARADAAAWAMVSGTDSFITCTSNLTPAHGWLPLPPPKGNRPVSHERRMPAKTEKSQSALAALLSILDLEPLEQNLFRGQSPKQGWQRVYGGQALGQALVAAVRTVDEAGPTHS